MSEKNYTVKIKFPVDEEEKKSQLIETKRVETFDSLTLPAVTELYNKYLEAGYKISATFNPPDDNNDEIATPFDMSDSLTKQGIDYKASLKIKTKGAFADMEKAIQLLDADALDYNLTATLKISSESSINATNPDTYQNEEAIYKIAPKINTKNVHELEDLYNNLNDNGYETEIVIKPKMPKKDEISDDITDAFSNQLNVYPDNTLVQLNLTQA